MGRRDVCLLCLPAGRGGPAQETRLWFGDSGHIGLTAPSDKGHTFPDQRANTPLASLPQTPIPGLSPASSSATATLPKAPPTAPPSAAHSPRDTDVFLLHGDLGSSLGGGHSGVDPLAELGGTYEEHVLLLVGGDEDVVLVLTFLL